MVVDMKMVVDGVTWVWVSFFSGGVYGYLVGLLGLFLGGVNRCLFALYLKWSLLLFSSSLWEPAVWWVVIIHCWWFKRVVWCGGC